MVTCPSLRSQRRAIMQSCCGYTLRQRVTSTRFTSSHDLPRPPRRETVPLCDSVGGNSLLFRVVMILYSSVHSSGTFRNNQTSSLGCDHIGFASSSQPLKARLGSHTTCAHLRIGVGEIELNLSIGLRHSACWATGRCVARSLAFTAANFGRRSKLPFASPNAHRQEPKS